MKKEATLNDVILRMKLIQTINPDIEFYLESYPTPHFVMYNNIVKFGKEVKDGNHN